jgi:hypothetical protein
VGEYATVFPMRPTSIAGRLLIALGTSLIALCLADCGYRFWLSSQDLSWDRQRVLRELEEQREQVLGEREWEKEGAAEKRESSWIVSPFVGYESKTSAFQLERQLRLQSEEGHETFTVMIVGGSVAAGFSYQGRARLLEILGSSPLLAGRKLRLINHARPAFKQPQQVTQAAYVFALGLAPDVVINLDGFNELAVAGINAKFDMHPAWPSVTQWLPLIQGGGDSEGLRLTAHVLVQRDRLVAEIDKVTSSVGLRSALVGSLYQKRIARAKVGYGSAIDELLASLSQGGDGVERMSPSFDGREGPLLVECTSIWQKSSISLHGICESHGIPYLHVLQPTLHDEGSKIATAEELETGKTKDIWERSARLGYPLLRAAGLELVERGIAFHDSSLVFRDVEETLYVDACHFGQTGNELLAEDIAEALFDLLSQG